MGSLRCSLGMDGPAVCGEVYVILLYQGACDSLFPPSCSILTPRATPGSSAGHRPPVPSLRVEALVPPHPRRAGRGLSCPQTPPSHRLLFFPRSPSFDRETGLGSGKGLLCS